ncbi:hypothetical protein [Bradyrhizobium sp. 145]|uniref:hypothetical protein n=1 Tax=Bradyrhizobium sp. 145 TaxID=2782621 RepID=UPI003211A3D2
MFKQVFSACLFVVLSSICSEARPYRIGHAPECNVIMPCDFSSAQTRGERISQYSLQAYRPKQLVVTAANSLAMSVPAESRIAGRPAARRHSVVVAQRCACLVVWCLN